MAVYGATFWIGACRERLVSLQLVPRGQIGNHAELIGRELLSDRTQVVVNRIRFTWPNTFASDFASTTSRQYAQVDRMHKPCGVRWDLLVESPDHVIA